MKRWWGRETLRFVDAWACREGGPEDEEDVVRDGATDGVGLEMRPMEGGRGEEEVGV